MFPRREHLRDSANKIFDDEKLDWPLIIFVCGAVGLFLIALAQWVLR